jgi:5-formyltetrahydrofolate cyclo-ligase
MKPDFQDNTWRSALRREMLAKRQAMSAELHAAASTGIAAHLATLSVVRPPAVIGFCWPIKQEPDVGSALEHWRQVGCRLALAVVVGENSALAFREWTPQTALLPDRYGIPTPQDGEWLQPDVLLLPLNAFDAQGYRLGYGGGYFDRTLASMQPRPLAVGLGFEINRVDSIRPQPHDQRLDWVVTEAGACRVQEA